jgi:hypothetical protein
MINLFLSCLLFLGTLQVSVFAQTPSMIYNVNRHSVREPRDTSTRESGAQLLSSAYDRLYIKGQHLRQKYPILSQTYKEEEIHVNSSAWQRTIATAHGILSGLYTNLNNNTMNIPVFTNPWEFDYTLYNYDKCPNYDAAWAAFQTTPEWTQQVQKYANLTSYLNGLLTPSQVIKLSNIFSIWDLYWIQRNRPEVGNIAPAIDDYTYNVLTEAATYVETMRYSSRVAGTYHGSTLLAAVKYRMEMFKTGNKVFGHRWISSSEHYATQLSLLAAMGYTVVVSKIIPDYNSVITFELYNKTNTLTFPSGWSVKMRYWDGLPNDNSVAIALGNCVEGQECEVDYNVFWSMYKTKDLKQWCKDCDSTLWMCKGANANTNGTNGTNDNNSSVIVYNDQSQSNVIRNLCIAVVVILSVFASIALTSCIYHKIGYNRVNSMSTNSV